MDEARIEEANFRAINKAKEELRQYVDRSFDYYAMKGLAIVDKTPEPMQIVKPLGGGKFVAFFAKHAQPDYKGTLRGGRTVVMEAKYTATDRLEQGRVKEGQADYLTRHQQLGALCYVIAGFDRVLSTVFPGMFEKHEGLPSGAMSRGRHQRIQSPGGTARWGCWTRRRI